MAFWASTGALNRIVRVRSLWWNRNMGSETVSTAVEPGGGLREGATDIKAAENMKSRFRMIET